jgi:hypothetical protein
MRRTALKRSEIERSDGPDGPVDFLGRALWLLIRFILFEFHHLHSTIPHGFCDFSNDVHRKETQPLLLVGVESLIDRLPCIGYPF